MRSRIRKARDAWNTAPVFITTSRIYLGGMFPALVLGAIVLALLGAWLLALGLAVAAGIAWHGLRRLKRLESDTK